jgi:DNA-binding transcriptional regulator/RsmH inhibitor MraZ
VQSGFYWGDFLFRGISSINLDDKGRLAIPTRYREMLRNCAEGQLVVTVAVKKVVYGFIRYPNGKNLSKLSANCPL